MEPEATGDAQEIQLLLFFPDICKEVGTAIATAVGRVCSYPMFPFSSKNNIFCTHSHPCLCRGSSSNSQPWFPGFRNGRSRQQCLCYDATPAACSPGKQRDLPRLRAGLELQDAFSRWSNHQLPSSCHCPENEDNASLAPFYKHCNRDDTTASCHSGIYLFRDHILL